MAKIGISTGIFRKFYGEEELNRKISHISRWNIDYVEVLLSRLFMLDIPITEENKKFLLGKKVIIHSPFFNNKGYDFCKLTEREIKKLVNIAKELKAEHIIIHPDLISSLDILKRFDYNFALENIKVNKEFRLEKMEKIFKKHPSLKLCLDINHSENLSYKNIVNILNKLNGTLAEVHFSVDDVNPFLGSKDNKWSFLKTKNIPIILESKIRDIGKTHLIIEKMREFFKDE